MKSFFEPKIDKILPTKQNLKEDNTFHEYEFRFNEIGEKMNLTKENFMKIFNHYKHSNITMTNEIIIDSIYNPKTIEEFFKNNNKDRKKKFMKKITYDNIYSDYDENFNILDFDATKNKTYKQPVEYMLKDKQKQYTRDHIRLSYNIETNLNNYITQNEDNITMIHSSNKPYKLIRFKNRYTFQLDKYFKVDLTIVKSLTPSHFKQKGPNEYIVEMEMTNLDDIKQMKLSLSKHLKTIMGLYYDVEDYIFSIKPMNPQTLEQKDLVMLKREEYSVTDKADGERMFLIFMKNTIYLRNPKTKEIYMEWDNKTGVHETIIDGEYLFNSNEFLAFDLLFYGTPKRPNDYADVRHYDLKKRLSYLENMIKKYLKKLNIEMKLKMKTFHFDIYHYAKDIWENQDKFNYNLDGLIFTPVHQEYTDNLDSIEKPTFKWKEKLSIDVRTGYIHKDKFTYFHYNNKGPWGKPWWNDPNINWGRYETTNYNFLCRVKESKLNIGKIEINRKNNKETFYLGLDNYANANSDINRIENKDDIVEYEFNFERNRWEAIRLRTDDKKNPNAYKTIESILNAIISYVSLNDIQELENLKLENIGALYDQTEDTVKRKNWRKFHNYVKREVLKKATDITETNYHLELACGKGGDLFKWQKLGYKNILAIDTSSNELYEKNGFRERLTCAGFVKKDYYYKKKDMKITIVLGDVSKPLKTCGLNDEENDKLNEYFKNLPKEFKGFDTIGIMFSIHYMFGDYEDKNKPWNSKQKKLEGFMKNLKENLKYGGVIMGTYLNGRNIENKTNEFIHNGKQIYKIEHLLNEKDNYKKYNDIWKNKKFNTINIHNEVWGTNVEIPEPKINNSILDIVFKEFGLKNMNKNNSFEQYYKDFQKIKNLSLGPDEQRLSFINNVFFYSSFDIDTFVNNINEHFKFNIFDKKKLIKKLKLDINDFSTTDLKIIYKNLYLNKN
jgi:hypothetical protein